MKERRSAPISRLCSVLLLLGQLTSIGYRGAAVAFGWSSTTIRIRPATSSLKLKPVTSAASRPSKYSIILRATFADNDGNEISSPSASNQFKVNDDNCGITNDDLQLQTSSPFLSIGYTISTVMNIAAAMSLIWGSCVSKPIVPSSTSASIQLLSTTHNYWDPAFTSATLSYLLLGAGTCHLLSKITRQSTQQDTQQLLLRQRLTLGTLLFSTISLFSIPGEAGYHLLTDEMKFATSLVLCQLSKLLTAATSFIGWEDTIAGGFGSSFSSRLKNMLCEIVKGVKSACRSLPITDTRPASFYRTFFIFVTLGNIAFNVPNLVFYLKEGVSWFSIPVSTIVSSIGRGSLLSVILFVLKEEQASRSNGIIVKDEEGIKEDKTKESGDEFIVLNMLVGMWAVGVGISQGFSAGIPFNLRRAADKFLFGLLFLNNGVLMQLTKMSWIKDRTEIDPEADPPLRIGL